MPRILPDVLTEADFPVVFGRYTLLGILGEGGMARVFKAEMSGPEGFKKRAAVKIVRSALAADNERLRTSLINEARLGGLLHHPNIVDTYDFGEVDGLPYIAMEYVRGIGLERVLHAVNPLPAEVAFEIAVQMCAGLDYAHDLEDVEGDSELVHRDLKPSNVILSRDGLVKVMDFGIAKAAAVSATNTATGMTKGTPSYMSPEQVNGDPLDRRSDLFAVGAILYELFTGKRLFMADSLMSILMAVMQVEERVISSNVLDELDLVQLGLTDVVRKCLRKDAGLRYGDASDLEHELKLLARTLPPAPPLKKWVRNLMEEEGIGSIGESSINTVPPVSPTQPNTPVAIGGAQPAAAAPPTPAPAPVPPTRPQQASLGAAPSPAAAAPQPAVPPTRAQQRPPPQAPPQTDPNRGAGAAPPPGTLWIGDEPPKKSSSLLLILLGLLVGGGLALIGAFGAMVFLGDDGPKYAANTGGGAEDPLALVAADEDVAADTGDAVADAGELGDADAASAAPAPRSAPAPAPREVTREEARPDPAPAPAATPEPAPEPVTPEPRRPDPTPEPVATLDPPEPSTPERVKPPRETAAPKEKDPTPAPRIESERTTRETIHETRPTSDRLQLTDVSARITDREGSEIKVLFKATLSGPCEEPRLRVSFNPPGARWVRRDMAERAGRDVWAVKIPFPKKNQGTTYWYVEARCAGGKRASYGNEDKPRKLKVE